jgi:hypothetical protein
LLVGVAWEEEGEKSDGWSRGVCKSGERAAVCGEKRRAVGSSDDDAASGEEASEEEGTAGAKVAGAEEENRLGPRIEGAETELKGEEIGGGRDGGP